MYMIDNHWNQGQIETMARIEWFHSGDQTVQKLERSLLIIEKVSTGEVEHSI